MSPWTLAVRNISRNRFRAIMTALAIAVSIIAFLVLRTIVVSWYAGIDNATKDRIATRNKVTFVMPLPKNYADKIALNQTVDGQPLGISALTWANWFGGKNANAKQEFFATLAVDASTVLNVYDEIIISPEVKKTFLENRRSALIGSSLAKKFKWKPGDKVNLEGTIYPGVWEFEIAGIYETSRQSLDKSTFFFHWNYLNEQVSVDEKDQIGWLVARIDDSSKSAQISKSIDALFENGADQTLTMSERQMNNSFLGMFSAILKVIDIISIVLLIIMMLILGNTIAMGVRERTNEYGMLRAIGFSSSQVSRLVIVESVAVAVIGATIGILLGLLLVNHMAGPLLEENMGAYFPYFRITTPTVVSALLSALVLGVLSSLIPSMQVAKLQVVDAIRKVG